MRDHLKASISARMISSLGHLPFGVLRAGFPSAAKGLQGVFKVLRPDPVAQQSYRFIRSCGLLWRMRHSSGSQDYPIYLINRRCDAERLESFKARADRFGLRFQRIEAINCADRSFDYHPLAAEIPDTFYGTTRFLRGAVGCFLSHVAAWRTFLESDAEFALICEDDACLLGPLPLRHQDYGIPEHTDLVFANQRMAWAALCRELPNLSSAKNFQFIPLNTTLEHLRSGSEPLNAPGGDAYIITRRGAKSLLQIFEESGVFMELDWYLFFHSLSPQERNDFLQWDGTGRFDALEFGGRSLVTQVLIPCLVEQAPVKSTIRFDDSSSYIERAEMFKGRAKEC